MSEQITQRSKTKPKVLLIGWDAADWEVIHPLIAEGKMPNLASFLEGGASGGLRTIQPVLSPMLWTSIATGKRPYKHGIHGFVEPSPSGSGVQPISNLGRSTKAIWNILAQEGYRSNIVGWWPSHPAEPIPGVMVSNFYQGVKGNPSSPDPMLSETVSPSRLKEALEEFRIHPGEIGPEDILPFIPRAAEIDQANDSSVWDLAKILAETASIQAAATMLMETEPWDFMAVYYDGIDHFSHRFMAFHPPLLPWIDPKSAELYSGVIEAAYRFHDLMLGALLQKAGEDTNVIIMSDHGFESNSRRLSWIPTRPAGPADEHRPIGILAMKGPAFRPGAPVFGASILDICPTILSILNLPIGRDMDGKVLVNILKNQQLPAPIDSWDSVPGDDGRHPQNRRMDAAASGEALQRLIDLGYVEPLDENEVVSAKRAARELKYNLSEAYIDGNLFGNAQTILVELCEQYPDELRFHRLLIKSLHALKDWEARQLAINRLEVQARLLREKSIPLSEKARQDYLDYSNDPEADPPTLRSKVKLARKLLEQSLDISDEVDWLNLTQDLGQRNFPEVKKKLSKLENLNLESLSLLLNLARIHLSMRDWKEAHRLFEKVLSKDPENAGALGGIAKTSLRLNRLDDAVEAALRSVEIDFSNPQVHFTLGCTWFMLGDFEKCEESLLVTVAQAPKFPRAHRLLGRLYSRFLFRPDRVSVHQKLARVHQDKHKQVFEEQQNLTVALSPTDALITSVNEDLVDHQVSPDQVITIVSGLPRSGTSMLMQMLNAGGLEPLTDNMREPDPSNPRGYFEIEAVKNLRSDQSWLPSAKGKVVKIVAPLIPSLPEGYHYQILLMNRPVTEVRESQATMLTRLNKSPSEIEDHKIEQDLTYQLMAAQAWLNSTAKVRALVVDYNNAIDAPLATAQKISQFVGAPLDLAAMTAAIDPSLKRSGTPNK
jgi:predicted AlkP superfamily phosphohydrolase/phosphomutase/tetratricopeptide (TPR) repeat protein